MVTDRDIVLRCVAAEEDPAQTPVRDIMTRNCAAVAPGDDCRKATQLMSVHQVRRLPVVENGKLVGMISLSDVARSGRFDLEAAQALAGRLELIGNIHSDGRPILGIPCRDLLEIMLETAPEGVYVPAHIWTPHFSLFGAFSGFDTIEDCFED